MHGGNPRHYSNAVSTIARRRTLISKYTEAEMLCAVSDGSVDGGLYAAAV